MSGSDGDGQVLVLQELVDADAAAFTAQSGLLDAAEGCGGVGDQSGVDADHAAFEAFGDPQGAVEVLGEQVGGQTEFGVVGGGDGLVLGLEGADRGDGAEDLGVDDRGVGGDTGEDGGRVEAARPFGEFTAGQDGGTALDGVPHQAVCLAAASEIDEGSDVGAGFGAGPDG